MKKFLICTLITIACAVAALYLYLLATAWA